LCLPAALALLGGQGACAQGVVKVGAVSGRPLELQA
jgi:hypothetical protein